MSNQAAWSLIVFYYHYLCRLSGRSASSFLFFVLFVLPSKRVTLQVTGRLWLIHIYSVWSLPESLAALCVGVGVLFVSCISGGHASDWSLATGSNAVVLVACMVACVESGVPGKVLSWRSHYNFIKRPEQAPGHLFYFYWKLGWSLESLSSYYYVHVFFTLDFCILMFLMFLMSFF